MKILVCYHRSDFDGILSGLVIKTYYKPTDTVVMLGLEYGDVMPTVEQCLEYDWIYVVDFSFEILQAPELKPKLVWIDHHKSAIEKYDSTLLGIRIDGVAACRLCWQYIRNPDVICGRADYICRLVNEPLLLQMAGEYDVWDKRNPGVDALQQSLLLKSIPELEWHLSGWADPGAQEELNDECSGWVSEGKALLAYREVLNKLDIKRAYFRRWEGLSFLCFNGSGNSLTFKDHPLVSEADALLMWKYNGDKVTISLYHTEHNKIPDLSLIAKKFGGGGHKGACGFNLSTQDVFCFNSILV